ncbi:hypothetical protein [Scytonema hofmannii]|uniref:hypothetical protein n=1 Tax=Scytonema hofmannii TaxID=34078 RepID=UPI0003462CFA|nr:hypothetical protein [Scytonema hofmannii]
MNDDRSRSSLLVPPSTQDWMQGVLSANADRVNPLLLDFLQRVNLSDRSVVFAR